VEALENYGRAGDSELAMKVYSLLLALLIALVGFTWRSENLSRISSALASDVDAHARGSGGKAITYLVGSPAAAGGLLGPPSSIEDVLPGVSDVIGDWRDWTPDMITVTLFPDLPITFHRQRVRRDLNPDGRHSTTWIGRPEGAPRGITLVGVASQYSNGSTGWQATLSLPSSSYDIYVSENQVRIAKHDERLNCGVVDGLVTSSRPPLLSEPFRLKPLPGTVGQIP
jgi:hypothetical protein